MKALLKLVNKHLPNSLKLAIVAYVQNALAKDDQLDPAETVAAATVKLGGRDVDVVAAAWHAEMQELSKFMGW